MLTGWEEVQNKAFKHWINTILDENKQIDKIEDFSDGITIISFVERLTNETVNFRYSKKPSLRLQKMENIYLALKYLKEKGVDERMVTAEPGDFVDQNTKFMLGFFWMLFRHFEIDKLIPGAEDRSSEESLLLWCKEIAADYEGVEITGSFSDSFQDGLAFLSIIDSYSHKYLFTPLFDFEDRKNNYTAEENMAYAFTIAQENIGVPQLLDVGEVLGGTADDRSIVLYLSLYFHAFVSAEEKKNLHQETLDKEIEKIEEEMVGTTLDIEMKIDEENKIIDDLSRVHSSLMESHTELKKDFKIIEKQNENYLEELIKEQVHLNVSLREWNAKVESVEKKFIDYERSFYMTVDLMRDNILQHLNYMHIWKDIVNEEIEYSSPKVVQRTNEELKNCDLATQIEYLCEALSQENALFEEYTTRYDEKVCINSMIDNLSETEESSRVLDDTEETSQDTENLDDLPLKRAKNFKNREPRPNTTRTSRRNSRRMSGTLTSSAANTFELVDDGKKRGGSIRKMKRASRSFAASLFESVDSSPKSNRTNRRNDRKNRKKSVRKKRSREKSKRGSDE
eukprot:TRINITY_DN12342_c0_g1_i1.p1 TRINITY_DN12342_c0_g1~~TRINITY_DN12342_c0_g1_i1.p1  ORF type:complete len:567 (+),score=158.48 TRINITY_DN12342_c0_g1_i1:17-1717(+)